MSKYMNVVTADLKAVVVSARNYTMGGRISAHLHGGSCMLLLDVCSARLGSLMRPRDKLEIQTE